MNQFYKKHRKNIWIASAILLLFLFITNKGAAEVTESTDTSHPVVTVFDAASIASTTQFIEANGTVETLEEVDLSSEVSARTAQVYVSLGDTVYAGQSLVVFSNADLAASLAGAEADVAGAIASKDNIEAQYTAKEISIQKTYTANQEAVTAAEIKAVASENTEDSQEVRDAYEDMVAVLRSIQDSLQTTLSTADSIVGYDNYLANDSFEDVYAKQDLGKKTQGQTRYVTAKEHKLAVDSLLQNITVQSSTTDIDAAIDATETALESYRVLLLTISDGLAATQPVTNFLTLTELATLKTSIQTARATIAGQIVSITNQSQAIDTAKKGYDSAVRDLAIARENLQSDLESGEAELSQIASRIALQDAQIQAAQARVSGIRASLAKTVVRTPISGTVAALPAKVGELMNPGMLAVRIVNTGAYQVKSYISADAVSFVQEGNIATIAGQYSGVVTNVSPSIDPQTNKVEVVVLVTSEEPLLVSEQFVSMSIERVQSEDEQFIRIPLESVRLTSKGATVLVVNENNILEERFITIGQVIGSEIEADISEIVLPIAQSVRGLEVGEEVTVQQ